jgi:hypothetical protein
VSVLDEVNAAFDGITLGSLYGTTRMAWCSVGSLIKACFEVVLFSQRAAMQPVSQTLGDLHTRVEWTGRRGKLPGVWGLGSALEQSTHHMHDTSIEVHALLVVVHVVTVQDDRA